MEEHREIIRVKRDEEENLLRMPGVHGVGVGRRQVKGQLTDEVVIRVYVTKKRPAHELAPSELIPSAIKGVKTDVIEAAEGEFIAEPGDFHHRPLASGLQIARYSGVLGLGQKICGTIGCFVRKTDGQPEELDADTLLLTNAHVLHPDLILDIALSDNNLYQNESILGANCIGVVDKNKKYCQFGYTVDAALALCDAGVEASNYVWKVGKIKGIAKAINQEKVLKFGRTTGRTVGVVDDIDFSTTVKTRGKGERFFHQIRIVPAKGGRFADHGDSGSVILNGNGELVGLLFMADTQRYEYAAANHIHNVFEALGVTLI